MNSSHACSLSDSGDKTSYRIPDGYTIIAVNLFPQSDLLSTELTPICNFLAINMQPEEDPDPIDT